MKNTSIRPCAARSNSSGPPSLKGPYRLDPRIIAAGFSPANVHRPGGPYALVTGRCVFLYDHAGRKFRLESLHSGQSLAEVKDNTGFDFAVPADIAETPPPDDGMLRLLRGTVKTQIAEVYPEFAKTRLSSPT